MENEYPIGPKTLRRLYTLMLKCRMMESKISRSRRGYEAVWAGATIGLRHDDYIAASEYSFISDVVSSLPPKGLLASGPNKRKESRRGVATPAPINSAFEFSLATGVALGFRVQKKHNVVVALSLSGDVSGNFWHEPAHFAATHKLPIVFVVVAPARNRSRADVSARAHKFGMPGIPVDINDAVAVYRVAHEAIQQARRGTGPALIECRAWAYSGADDPIAHMQQYLEWKGLWSEGWSRQVKDSVREEVSAARRASH